jgi:hypothetical protein
MVFKRIYRALISRKPPASRRPREEGNCSAWTSPSSLALPSACFVSKAASYRYLGQRSENIRSSILTRKYPTLDCEESVTSERPSKATS